MLRGPHYWRKPSASALVLLRQSARCDKLRLSELRPSAGRSELRAVDVPGRLQPPLRGLPYRQEGDIDEQLLLRVHSLRARPQDGMPELP